MTLALIGSATRPQDASPRTIKVYDGSAPVAGAEWTETVPATEYWRIVGVEYNILTSATVATRVPTLKLAPLGNLVLVIYPNLVVPAVGSYTYYFGPGVGFSNTPGIANAPIPDALLPPASVVSSITFGMQVGDQYGAPRFWVEATSR